MGVLFTKVADNVLDFQEIDVLEFNYDGQGSALALADNVHTITICLGDLEETVFDEDYYKIS